MSKIKLRFKPINIETARKLLNCSDEHVRTLVKQGRLKAMRLPGRYVLDEKEVIRLVATRRVTPVATATVPVCQEQA